NVGSFPVIGGGLPPRPAPTAAEPARLICLSPDRFPGIFQLMPPNRTNLRNHQKVDKRCQKPAQIVAESGESHWNFHLKTRSTRNRAQIVPQSSFPRL